MPSHVGYFVGVAGDKSDDFLSGVRVPDDAGTAPAGGGDEVFGGVPGDPGHFIGVAGEGGAFLACVGVPDDAVVFAGLNQIGRASCRERV